jgi:hypothetical protein
VTELNHRADACGLRWPFLSGGPQPLLALQDGPYSAVSRVAGKMKDKVMAPGIRLSVALPTHNEESNMRPSTAVSSQVLNSNLCRKPTQPKTLLFASTSFLSAFLLFQVSHPESF